MYAYFRLVNLTDCANIYSSVLSLNPKTVDKLTKINLSYIRDAVSNGVLSFIDACANLADLGTRNSGNFKIFEVFAVRAGSTFLLSDAKGRNSFETRKIV